MRKFFSRYKLIKIIGGALLGLLLVLGIAWLRLDSAIAYNLRRTLNTTLGVPARIEQLHYRLLAGQLTIGRLTLDNPEGFSTPYFMNATGLEIQANPSTFLSPKVEIQTFTIESLDLYIEQQVTRNNAFIILGNAKKQRQKNLQANLLDRAQKFELKRAIVKNVTSQLNLGLGARSEPLSLPLPPLAAIEINNITPENMQGVILSDAIDRVVSGIVRNVVVQSQKRIPQNILKILENLPLPADSRL